MRDGLRYTHLNESWHTYSSNIDASLTSERVAMTHSDRGAATRSDVRGASILLQPIAFGVSFLHSQISIDDLVL